MTILSEERQTHLAHIVIDGIWEDDIVDYSDDDEAIRCGKNAIVKFVQEAEAVDAKVRETIGSLKRGVSEGTPEFDILYSKYYEEELKRRGSL